MRKTIGTKFTNGVIKPLEKVYIEEGKEIVVTITEVSLKPQKDAFEKSAGAWKDLINCDELIKNIYSDRLISTRPEINLK